MLFFFSGLYKRGVYLLSMKFIRIIYSSSLLKIQLKLSFRIETIFINYRKYRAKYMDLPVYKHQWKSTVHQTMRRKLLAMCIHYSNHVYLWTYSKISLFNIMHHSISFMNHLRFLYYMFIYFGDVHTHFLTISFSPIRYYFWSLRFPYS